MTGKKRPDGSTVVLHCRSLRERVASRIKGGHVHSILRLLARWGLPELQPAGTPTGPKKGGGGHYELTFVQPPPPPPSLFLPRIFSYAFYHPWGRHLVVFVHSSASLDPPACPSVHCLWGGTVPQRTPKDVGVSPTLACYRLPNDFPGASRYLGAGDAPFYVQAAASPPPCGTPGRTKI